MSIIGFIGCSILLLYPYISDKWNRYHDSKLITNYNDVINTVDKNDYDLILKEIEDYNTALRQRSRLIISFFIVISSVIPSITTTLSALLLYFYDETKILETNDQRIKS